MVMAMLAEDLNPGREYEVEFHPDAKTGSAKPGESLLAVALRQGIEFDAACAGKGSCGKCRCDLISGALSPPTEDELGHLSEVELGDNVRLACQARIHGDVRVRVTGNKASSLRVVEQGRLPDFDLHPTIDKVLLDLAGPSDSDDAADLERVRRELDFPFSRQIGLHVMRSLPAVLRDSDFKVTVVVREGEAVGIEAGDTRGRSFGVALDIGTTTLVASLVDLTTGEELHAASLANSQRAFGLDVLSRIQFAGSPEGLARLHEAIIKDVNGLLARLCKSLGVPPHEIYEITVAGNTTMLHLFAGVPPSSLGASPYVSCFQGELNLFPSELGIGIAECGRITLLPSVSSYVGADIVAGIITAELTEVAEPVLLIDIGTNGELVLGAGSRMVACSCAAGPALEGMNIECGTVAVDGAIEKVEIAGGAVRTRTIGGKPPIGLSGSGVVDAVAELLRCGVIHASGRMCDRAEFLDKNGDADLAGRLPAQGDRRFLLAEGPAKEIYLSQKDVRQVQLAKAAISSGIRALFQAADVSYGEVSDVFLAGGFGQHLRLQSLFRLGLIPQELAPKVAFIGNSAKAGAHLALVDKGRRQAMRALREHIRYFELSNYPGYQELFVEAMAFPKGSPGHA